MRNVLGTVTAVLALALLAGCGKDTGPAPEPPAGDGAQAPKAPTPEPAKPAALPKARPPVKAADVTAENVRAAAEKAAAFLVSKQKEDGSFGEFGPSVGMTGLAALALAESGVGGDAAKKAVERAIAFILANKQPDGGIYMKGKPYNSYETSITVMVLAAVDREKYKAEIDGGVKFLKGIQNDGAEKPTNKGGIGYGSKGVNSNLSTTHYALQALKAAGVKEDDEAWKKALAFVAMCQNDSEVNNLEYAAVVNDGGFIYSPVESKAGEVTVRGRKGWRSYGSMTYAGYLSYVYAKLSPDDQRVKGAEKWLAKNYTLEENPGMGGQGLYYYYHTFALAFAARGKPTFKLADGKEISWARDLGAKLLTLQESDGGWTNAADRWHEGSRVMCASYSLRALGKVLGGLK
ncbi:MAG: prenyltransferase/squalene oxidase repeat-containing protein [Planctomycetota bacterium]|jgi:squalene-hopene/tetraprenyl-beta-curcumene cyclase